MNGNAKSSKTLLDPIRVVMYPTDNEPTTAPMQLTEAIHEISALVNGPVKSGVLFDANIGNAPDIHPI